MAQQYCQYKNLKAKLRLLDALLSKQQDVTCSSWVSHTGTQIYKRHSFHAMRQCTLQRKSEEEWKMMMGRSLVPDICPV